MISLCLIARDEEAMLGRCLAAARAACDELIVVDTGSTDRTVEIAEDAGATVVSHPWRDDFAAARNAALEAAHGDWVLLLDADEVLVHGERVRKAVAADRLDCGLLPLCSAASLDAAPAAVVSGAARRGEPALLPRLLRRTPDLRWHGVVHEHVEPWLRAPGRRIERVDAGIAHYGGLAEVVQARGKTERNQRLLHKRLQLQPDDAEALTYLGMELVKAGRATDALSHLDRAWPLLRDKPGNSLVPVATWRGLGLLQLQRFDDAIETARVAARERRVGQIHPNLHYIEGVGLENRALHRQRPLDLPPAAAAYARATECDGRLYPHPVIPGATSWAAATRLGTVLLQLDRAPLALQVFDAALATRPDHAEAALGRVEALLALDRQRDALRALRPLMAGGTADAWLLAAIAAGERPQAAEYLERARALARTRLIGLHRLARLNALLGAG